MATQWEAKKGVKVDHKGLNKTITIYVLAMRRSLEGFLKQQARLFAQDMCDFTPPFSGTEPAIRKGGEGGFGNKAKKKGQNAVDRDVRKIFAPLAQAPAAGVAAYGNIGIFNAWISEKLKLPAPHQPEYVFKMYQDRGGIFGQGEFDRFKAIEARQGTPKTKFMLGTSESEVKSKHKDRRGDPSYKVTKTPKSEMIYVDNFKVVERYIKKVQQRVGKLKSGWYYAGLKLGSMPTSAWIMNQGNSTSIYLPRLGGLILSSSSVRPSAAITARATTLCVKQ